MTDVSDRLQAALADRYRIERELGSGGMATVYLAEDLKHHRNVAIKVLREDIAASIGAIRFLREIEIAAQLQHPNILTLLDSGNANGFLFYVMPYVSGQSLRERLSREGELPVHEAARLLAEVVDALSHAHEHGVVHRDIKPDNVMLSGRHALVADFGVAKAVSDASAGSAGVTSVGLAVGTPAYMSPEQASADPGIDHRSDIYSVGVMAYEMLTGRTPFVGATAAQILAAQVTQTADPLSRHRPGLPAALEAVIMRCLEKRPSDRWQSASQLHAALEPFATASTGTTPTDTPPHVRKPGGFPKWIAGAVAAVVLIAAVTWFATGRRATASDGAPSSIAVIPFENLSGDTSMVYFASGMADEMANALSSIPGLRVMARTSAGAFEGKHATPQEIGKALNVDVVLMGSVRRNGDRLLVSAHVDRTSDGSQMFAERYDTVYANVFSVQESLARGVANRLQASLKPAAKTSVHALRGTDDVAAYDLYMKGEYLFARRGGENLKHAAQYFDQAIARDPNFARAHAGLAMVYSILPGWAQADNSVLQKGEASARRAIELDSTLVEGRLALANTLTALGRSAEAEQEFALAVAMDPGNATGHQWRGANFNYLARGDDAIRELKAATTLDPLSAVAFSDLAFAAMSAHRWADALAAFHEGTRIDPEMGPLYLTGAITYAELGKVDSAVWAFERAYKLDPETPGSTAYHVWRYAIVGKRAEAQAAFEEFNRTITGSSRAGDMVVAQLGLGNREAALAALEAAAKQRWFTVTTSALGCDPTFAAIKSEPRFIAVVKQLGQNMCADNAPPIIPPRAATR
jgi:serine/threonine protein kinase/tetratricopeptide (TPR) repeat protein